LRGYDRPEAIELVASIEPTMAAIFAEAEAAGITPLEAARRRSEQRLHDEATLATGGA
jgi:hypothetical protein